MFEKILLRSNVPGQAIIEPGTLAEAMLFYGQVNIVVEFGSLIKLVKTYGLDTLEILVKEGYINLIFSPYQTCTITDSEFTEKENFDFGSSALSSASGNVDYENAFFTALYRGSGKRGKSKRVSELVDKHGFTYNKVSVKRMTSRWGSCTAMNNINLNIKLLQLPDELCDYVILHELVHTIHKNHGQLFWKVLSEVCEVENAKVYQRELTKISKNIL